MALRKILRKFLVQSARNWDQVISPRDIRPQLIVTIYKYVPYR